jgi:hypothetical protein
VTSDNGSAVPAPPSGDLPVRHSADRLYVGTDAEKTIVGSDPVRLRTGRAARRRWGSIIEVTPAAPSGRSRDERTRSLSQLALGLLALVVVLAGAGIPWWVGALGALALLATAGRLQSRAAARGVLALPRGRGRDTLVLYAPEERAAFAGAFAIAKRVQRTWPALRHMIEPAEAERMLSRALRDLAAVLGRRQQIRRLRTELAGVDHRDLPRDSPAVTALLEQRARADELWRTVGEEANRHFAAITAAATAGEYLIREQQVGRTAREAEHAIARLTASAVLPVGEPDAGRELADRTAAVIDAYRDLAARYGTGV